MSRTFFLVEDHSLMKKGIEAYLCESGEWQCAGTARNASCTLDAMRSLASEDSLPDIAIVDVSLGKDNGLDLIKTLHKEFPALPLLVYSMHSSSSVVNTAFENGALGFLSKAEGEEKLKAAIETVSKGSRYIPEALVSPLIEYGTIVQSLTSREKEVLHLVLEGFSNDKIAKTMGIQKRAVENYVSRLYDKAGLHTRDELCKKFS